jgi:hypothetical protein
VRVKCALLALALAAAILPLPPGAVEYVYARRIYPVLQRALTWFSNVSAVALFDFLAILVAVLIVGRWVWRLRSAEGRRWRAAVLSVVDTSLAGAAIYLVFLGVWGLNYRREPLTTRLDFAPERVSVTALVDFTRVAIDQLNRLHETAWREDWRQPEELPGAMARGFERAQRDLYSGSVVVPPLARPGRPKRTFLTWYFERSGVDGMTDPFLLEVLINQALLPFERPFVVAHEWAHLAGHADESEANFVGWLVCLRGNEQAQYSGWLAIYLQAARALPPADRTMLAALEAGPRRDITAVIERQRRSIPIVREAAERVYDRFLKANRVEAGIASYDAVVQLILGTRFREPWIPVPRGSGPSGGE